LQQVQVKEHCPGKAMLEGSRSPDKGGIGFYRRERSQLVAAQFLLDTGRKFKISAQLANKWKKLTVWDRKVRQNVRVIDIYIHKISAPAPFAVNWRSWATPHRTGYF
jgi:hypothetical protein